MELILNITNIASLVSAGKLPIDDARVWVDKMRRRDDITRDDRMALDAAALDLWEQSGDPIGPVVGDVL